MNWNIEALQAPPNYEVITSTDSIEAITFDNEPYFDQPTQVFAYTGIPKTTQASVPGMVCVHGGGGKAFKEWVQLWNDRGYAAISMDLSGRGPDGQRLPHGGPEQDHNAKFNLTVGWKNLWTYHAIAAVIRSHSLLRAQPSVDPQRIGVTGISWGGYLTCIAAGVDPRFACAIPVYGCGYLQHNSAIEWMQTFDRMTTEERTQWHNLCDPAAYLPHSRMPMLFVTGTNDFAYPLDSLKKSYSVVKGPVTLCVRLEMPHGHEAGWAPKEIHRFTDSRFRQTPAFPQIGPMTRRGGVVWAPFCSEQYVGAGYLLYTQDKGAWQARKWHQVSANLNEQTVSAELPENVAAYFLAIEDETGTYVSSAHEEMM
ncbi:alpha/beta fold hydrolase [Candidatus Poribacteria bacterium]|nr:alpha/beta fold hydrolase [Candidatus Poribacteria bacterium]